MSAAMGTDWTRILSDPDLVRQVGKLLQAYREAAPDQREEAMMKAMREIKAGKASARNNSADASHSTEETFAPQAVPTPASSTPPFEPDLFENNERKDR